MSTNSKKTSEKSRKNPKVLHSHAHFYLTPFTQSSSQTCFHMHANTTSQTSHMHSYTIPTKVDTLKHHSDLSNRLQLDSVPEPYIYPLLLFKAQLTCRWWVWLQQFQVRLVSSAALRPAASFQLCLESYQSSCRRSAHLQPVCSLVFGRTVTLHYCTWVTVSLGKCGVEVGAKCSNVAALMMANSSPRAMPNESSCQNILISQSSGSPSTSMQETADKLLWVQVISVAQQVDHSKLVTMQWHHPFLMGFISLAPHCSSAAHHSKGTVIGVCRASVKLEHYWAYFL